MSGCVRQSEKERKSWRKVASTALQPNLPPPTSALLSLRSSAPLRRMCRGRASTTFSFWRPPGQFHPSVRNRWRKETLTISPPVRGAQGSDRPALAAGGGSLLPRAKSGPSYHVKEERRQHLHRDSLAQTGKSLKIITIIIKIKIKRIKATTNLLANGRVFWSTVPFKPAKHPLSSFCPVRLLSLLWVPARSRENFWKRKGEKKRF